MDADEALLDAWTVDDNADGWTDEVMRRVDELLPTLVAGGYAEVHGGHADAEYDIWDFSDGGVTRVGQLLRFPDGLPTSS